MKEHSRVFVTNDAVLVSSSVWWSFSNISDLTRQLQLYTARLSSTFIDAVLLLSRTTGVFRQRAMQIFTSYHSCLFYLCAVLYFMPPKQLIPDCFKISSNSKTRTHHHLLLFIIYYLPLSLSLYEAAHHFLAYGSLMSSFHGQRIHSCSL